MGNNMAIAFWGKHEQTDRSSLHKKKLWLGRCVKKVSTWIENGMYANTKKNRFSLLIHASTMIGTCISKGKYVRQKG